MRRPALCPGPPLMPWQWSALPGAFPGRREESRHAGPTASPSAAITVLTAQRAYLTCGWARQAGGGANARQRAVARAPLQIKWGGCPTNGMLHVSNVGSSTKEEVGGLWETPTWFSDEMKNEDTPFRRAAVATAEQDPYNARNVTQPASLYLVTPCPESNLALAFALV